MSAFRPGGNMRRGPWEMTSLLLLLLLLTSLAGTALCQDEVEEPEPDDTVNDNGNENDVPTDPASIADDTSSSVLSDVSETTLVPDTSSSVSSPTTVEEFIDGDLGSAEDKIDFSPNYFGVSEDFLSDPSPAPLDEGLSPIIILVPVLLVVVIIAIVVCGIGLNRRWNRKKSNADHRKEDPYLDEASTEKVPMPMFEDDVPSVLELEMEELDEWMNKDGGAAMDSKHT